MTKDETLMCPSAPAKKDSFLLGVLDKSVGLNYIQDLTRIDANLLRQLKKMGKPEKHFRFTTICQQGKCSRWNSNKCSIAATISKVDFKDIQKKPTLQKCAIRKACRWFSQEGLRACKICMHVVTDLSQHYKGWQ